jgi:hypothetical protein
VNIQKKPPVSAITGMFQPDSITQVELQALGEHQASEWVAAQETHKLALGIEDRLKQGATIEKGVLTFLLLFLIVMPACYVAGYVKGIRKGLSRANRRVKPARQFRWPSVRRP